VDSECHEANHCAWRRLYEGRTQSIRLASKSFGQRYPDLNLCCFLAIVFGKDGFLPEIADEVEGHPERYDVLEKE
jgi:hypothetical protein